MAPENRIDKLLPVWPTAPLKEFRGGGVKKPPAGTAAGEEEKQRKERPGQRSPEGPDEEGHIDLYA